MEHLDMKKEETTEEKKVIIEKQKKPRQRRPKIVVPIRPAIPVRSLWRSATVIQQQRAHEMATALMEFWLGKSSRVEIAKRLEVAPIRIWQLSQQAVSGLLAGLLEQPKNRLKGVTMNPEDDPKILRKRIAELEKKVEMQDRLIAVLRMMPGCHDVELPKEGKTNETDKSEVYAETADGRSKDAGRRGKKTR